MTYDELLALLNEYLEYQKNAEEEWVPTEALIAVAKAHTPETDYNNRLVCGHCKSLCHSETGLHCDWGGDALYPCCTIKIIEESIK